MTPLVETFWTEIGIMAPWMDADEVRRWAERLAALVPPADPSAQREASLARLNLNLNTCPRCHLPKVDGLVCVCGWDGSDDPMFPSPALVEKVDREFR